MIWGNVFLKVFNYCVGEFMCLLLESSYTSLCSAFQRQCGLSWGSCSCQDDPEDVCYHLLARSYQIYSRISRADDSCLLMFKLFPALPHNLYTEVATENLGVLLHILFQVAYSLNHCAHLLSECMYNQRAYVCSTM